MSCVPSATVLHLLRESARPTSDLPLLALGDVQYRSSDRTLLASKTDPLEQTRGLFDIAAAHLTELPSTAEEIASVAEAAGESADLLVGWTATESGFKSKDLRRFKVLHLAVHGIANPQFPHRAALVLGKDPESADDGLLQVREILNLRLAAELVTLSACDTAAGRLEGQDGITSLVRAFLLAGARTAVASLWAADDVFTTALMRRFYTHRHFATVAKPDRKGYGETKALRAERQEAGNVPDELRWGAVVDPQDDDPESEQDGSGHNASECKSP